MNGFIYEKDNAILRFLTFNKLLTFQIKSLKGFETTSKKKNGISQDNTS